MSDAEFIRLLPELRAPLKNVLKHSRKLSRERDLSRFPYQTSNSFCGLVREFLFCQDVIPHYIPSLIKLQQQVKGRLVLFACDFSMPFAAHYVG